MLSRLSTWIVCLLLGPSLEAHLLLSKSLHRQSRISLIHGNPSLTRFLCREAEMNAQRAVDTLDNPTVESLIYLAEAKKDLSKSLDAYNLFEKALRRCDTDRDRGRVLWGIYSSAKSLLKTEAVKGSFAAIQRLDPFTHP